MASLPLIWNFNMRCLSKILWLSVIGALLCMAPAHAQNVPVQYKAWLDSMQIESYIAWEALLDEMEVRHEDDAIHTHYQKYITDNTDRLLHHLPGMHMMRRGNFANEPLLRGLNSDRYVITVNNMKVFGACTDKMDPVSSYIEPINLQSMDISFGAQNSMTGSGTGGSVNFNLKRPVFNNEKPVSASLSMLYNSVSGGFDQAADVSVSKGKLGLRLSGVHRKANNYRDGRGEEVRYSQYEKYNYAASLQYRLTDDQLLVFDFLGDDALNVGYPALPMDVAYARAKMFGLSYMFPRLGFIIDPEIKIYHNFIRHAMDDTQRKDVVMHMDMPGETHTSGGYLKATLIATNKNNLDINLDYYSTFARAEMVMYPNNPAERPMFMLTWPDVRRQSGSVGLDYSRKINDRWVASAGLRTEHGTTYISSEFGEQQLSVFEKTGKGKRHAWLLASSMGIQWKPTDSQQYGWKMAYSERLPTTSEQFGYFLFNRLDNHDYIGDPDLKKEGNLHLEVSNQIKTSKLTLNTALFSYLFSNYIMGIYNNDYAAMTIGADGVKVYKNTSHATMIGGEMNALYNVSSKSLVELGLKYVYGQDFEGKPLPQMPPLKLNVGYSQEVLGMYIIPELEWSANQHRISDKFNERATDAYWLLNLSIKKHLSSERLHWEFRGGVDNILNKAYREHFDIGDIMRPGRNFVLQVKVSY